MSSKNRWGAALASITGAALLAGGGLAATAPLAMADEAHPVAISTLFAKGNLGQVKTVKGYVTAEYSDGGLGGFMVQKANSGGSPDTRVQAPQAIRIRGARATVGDYVMVTGTVSDGGGLRGLNTSQDQVRSGIPKETAKRPVPITDLSSIKGSWTDEATLARISGMLVQPQNGFTVTGLDHTADRGEVTILPAATSQKTDQGATPLLMLDDGAIQDSSQRPPQRSWSGVESPAVGDQVSFIAHSILMPAVDAPGRTDGWHFQPTGAVTSTMKVLPTRITKAAPQGAPSSTATPPAATIPASPSPASTAADTKASDEPTPSATPSASATRRSLLSPAVPSAPKASQASEVAQPLRPAATRTPSSPAATPSASASEQESDGELDLPALPKSARGNLSRPIASGSSTSATSTTRTRSGAGSASAGGSSGATTQRSTTSTGRSTSAPGSMTQSSSGSSATGATGSGKGAAPTETTRRTSSRSHEVAEPRGATSEVIQLTSAQSDPPLSLGGDQSRLATTLLVGFTALLAIAVAVAGVIQKRRSS